MPIDIHLIGEHNPTVSDSDDSSTPTVIPVSDRGEDIISSCKTFILFFSRQDPGYFYCVIAVYSTWRIVSLISKVSGRNEKGGHRRRKKGMSSDEKEKLRREMCRGVNERVKQYIFQCVPILVFLLY